MATYTIEVNERTSLGKSTVKYLQSIPQVVRFEMPTRKKRASKETNQVEETISKAELLENLNSAFRDVKLMIDGKKREISAEELLYELKNGI